MIPVMIGKKEMFIRGEDKQWTLGKMVQSTDKETSEVTEAYHAELFWASTEGMIKGVLEKKLRASDANTLSELQDSLRRAKDELRGLYDLSD